MTGRIVGASVERLDGQSMAAPGNDTRRRLAVLPFTHLGESSAPESFASGLSEELVTELGRIACTQLGIIARSSCLRVQRAGRTAREVAAALRADYLLEGTVRTDATRVRVTAQLVEAAGETHLWAESYDRPFSDVLLVQSDVAAEIVRGVSEELLPARRTGHATGTRSLAARQAYLKGRYYWHRPGEEGLRECLAFYQEALTVDPAYAAAHGAFARATIAAAEYYLDTPRTLLDRAERAAERALALEIGRAHV